MGYRNITVDGVKYKYVIGKTHTKIHGVRKVFENQKIGSLWDTYCECCGSSYRELYCDEKADEYRVIRVTPADVANAIRSLK